MDNREKWWPWKIQCLLMYGRHASMTRPEEGLVHVTAPLMSGWLSISSHRLKGYLQTCEELGMIEELKSMRGFHIVKLAKFISTENNS
jgi:hypothetical protein